MGWFHRGGHQRCCCRLINWCTLILVVSLIIQLNYLFTWLFNSSKDNYKVRRSKENKEINTHKGRQRKETSIFQIITIKLMQTCQRW
jgi:hypothetical protein